LKLQDILVEEPTISGVNIVPVIDLCLVLLIILMVTSPLLDTADLPVKLPQAATIESKERNISVTVAQDGRIAINTDVVEANQLVPSLRALLRADQDTMVILRVDRTSSYVSLTDLIAQCKRAGATNISIGTEQKKING
jgi:biopolymer transport protein ExbD